MDDKLRNNYLSYTFFVYYMVAEIHAVFVRYERSTTSDEAIVTAYTITLQVRYSRVHLGKRGPRTTEQVNDWNANAKECPRLPLPFGSRNQVLYECANLRGRFIRDIRALRENESSLVQCFWKIRRVGLFRWFIIFPRMHATRVYKYRVEALWTSSNTDGKFLVQFVCTKIILSSIATKNVRIYVTGAPIRPSSPLQRVVDVCKNPTSVSTNSARWYLAQV